MLCKKQEQLTLARHLISPQVNAVDFSIMYFLVLLWCVLTFVFQMITCQSGFLWFTLYNSQQIFKHTILLLVDIQDGLVVHGCILFYNNNTPFFLNMSCIRSYHTCTFWSPSLSLTQNHQCCVVRQEYEIVFIINFCAVLC